MATVLGIETSCDDTSVALVAGEPGEAPARPPRVLACGSFDQGALLAPWGGVVPEVAARNHAAKLVPLMRDVFRRAGLGPPDADAVAVTTSPGLLGPLLTGLGAAKTLSLALRVPVVPVNHVHAHVEAVHLEPPPVPYPYVGMVASGGHGLYLLVRSPSDAEVLGGTLDDAPGEALDKGGKLLGLGYPAGPEIDRLAARAPPPGPAARPFPVALADSPGPDLSFSGLKTALRERVRREGVPSGPALAALCRDYQEAVVRALGLKLGRALEAAERILGGARPPAVVGGGVARNSRLREVLARSFPGVRLVPARLCADNGAMVAGLGLRLLHRAAPFPDSLSLDARGRFP